MSAEAQIAGLLRLAAEDLRGARLLARDGNRNAIYLCSQAAEKVIRAVLTSEGEHAGIRHLLDEMVDQVPDDNPLKPSLRAVQHLGGYATSFRYPTTTGRILPSPSHEDIDRDAARIEEALRRAVAHFEVDLSDARKPAGNAHPMR